MSDYKKILVAVDYSPHSDRVLEQACRMARDHHAELLLVHIVEYLPPMVMGAEPFPSDLWVVDEEQLLETARNTMKDLVAKIHGINVTTQVVLGNTRLVLESIAEDQDADLIVAGAHGRHGLARLLGSTATSLVHHVNCDLLLVRLRES
jgi:universal stress protein A